MEKKYIIKLEENEIAYKTVNSNGCPMIGLLHPAPYTEPDLEQVRKEAYQHGLSDAWEAARKVTQVRKYGGYGDCLEEVFGRHRVPWDVFDYSASEVIEKIRQYEQEKGKYHVGDEFEVSTGERFIVTKMSGDEVYAYIDKYGTAYQMCIKYAKMHKTGRHFPEIAEVLQKMKKS